MKEDAVKHDLGRVLLKLEELQDAAIRQALKPKPKVAVSEDDRAAALELLQGSRICSIASSPTSSAAAWWAKRPTSWSAISPPCRGVSMRRWRWSCNQFRRRQELADGSGARLRSRRGARASTRR